MRDTLFSNNFWRKYIQSHLFRILKDMQFEEVFFELLSSKVTINKR